MGRLTQNPIRKGLALPSRRSELLRYQRSTQHVQLINQQKYLFAFFVLGKAWLKSFLRFVSVRGARRGVSPPAERWGPRRWGPRRWGPRCWGPRCWGPRRWGPRPVRGSGWERRRGRRGPPSRPGCRCSRGRWVEATGGGEARTLLRTSSPPAGLRS